MFPQDESFDRGDRDRRSSYSGGYESRFERPAPYREERRDLGRPSTMYREGRDMQRGRGYRGALRGNRYDSAPHHRHGGRGSFRGSRPRRNYEEYVESEPPLKRQR